MDYKLGETEAEVEITTAEENRSAAISLVKQASYSIDIFSQDLDAEIYNNKEFEKALFELARKHPNTRIRILVQDSRKAAQDGHCLIRLAQSLTSSVFIHTPSRQHRDEQRAFLVVDKLGLLYRVTTADRNYKASVNFKSPRRAGELTDYFDEVWEHSTPDIQTRRIYM
jgi:hypothetical protein